MVPKSSGRRPRHRLQGGPIAGRTAKNMSGCRKRNWDGWSFSGTIVLCAFLAVWVAIVALVKDDAKATGWHDTIKAWQTLFAAGIAVVAACIAWWNTSRQIQHAERLEKQRRAQKRSALRSMLPLVLSEISEYAQESMDYLRTLHGLCMDELVPVDAELPEFPAVPSDSNRGLMEFIEYADGVGVNLFEKTLQRIQVQNARFRKKAIVRRRYTKSWIEENIILTALIYSGASQAFDYARKKTDNIPNDATWADVQSALRILWGNKPDIPRVLETIGELERQGVNPE
jgi:hypothetical protein